MGGDIGVFHHLPDAAEHDLVDFTSEEDARTNSDRPETQRWAEGLKALAGDTPMGVASPPRS